MFQLCKRLTEALYFNFTEANSRKKKVYEQQENEENPLRCPVKLYEFYISKWYVWLEHIDCDVVSRINSDHVSYSVFTLNLDINMYI